MYNNLNKLLSIIIIVVMLTGNICVNAAYSNYGEADICSYDFDDYTATSESPAVPNGLWGTGNDGGKLFSEAIDDEHGRSLVIEDPSRKSPWFGTTSTIYNSGYPQDCILKLSFDYMNTGNYQNAFFGFIGDYYSGETLNQKSFGNIIDFTGENTVRYYGLSSDNAESAGLFAKYTTIAANEWMHFDVYTDLVNHTYDVFVGKGSETPVLLAEDVSLCNGSEVATPFFAIRHFRFTVRGVENKNVRPAFDNFTFKKLYEMPEINDISYTDDAISITFSKDMKASTFENNVELFMGNEEVKVPFTGNYDNKVYTLTPSSGIKTGVKYNVKFSPSVTCVEGGQLPVAEESIFVPSEDVCIKDDDVVFNSTDSSVTAAVTLPETISEKVHIVLGVYDGDCLIGNDVETIPAGTVTNPVNLSALAADADGAVVYLLDDNLVPLCDSVIMAESEVTSGIRNDQLPSVFSQYYYNANTDSVKVYGKSNAGDIISVVISKGNTANILDIAGIRQVMAKENGYFETVLKIDTSKIGDVYKFPSDDYTVSVFSSEDTSENVFKYSNSVEALSAMGAVTGASSNADVENIITVYEKVFALDKTDYNNVDDKEALHDLILTEELSEYTTGAQFKNAFDRAVAVSLINEDGDVADIIEKYAPEFGIDATDFSSLEDMEMAISIIRDTEYTDFDDFVENYNDAVMLSKIYTAPNTGILEDYLLTEYDSRLDLLGNAEYARKYNKIKEKNAVFSRIIDKKYMNVEELVKAFKSAVKTVYDKENNSSGNKGSSGGSGFSSTVSVPAPSTAGAQTKLVFADINPNDNAMLEELVKSGVIAGDGNGNFRPYDTIRRDEFAKMMVVGLQIYDEGAVTSFEDVSISDWSYKYIASAVALGITNGVGNNNFAPERNISRQDAATMLYRAIEKAGLLSNFDTSVNAVFADRNTVADYASDAVDFMYGNILKVDNNTYVFPSENATRLEVAEFVYKFMQIAKGGK